LIASIVVFIKHEKFSFPKAEFMCPGHKKADNLRPVSNV
jgi:hypothetical protein